MNCGCDGRRWTAKLALFLFGGLRLAWLWLRRVDKIAMTHHVDVAQTDHFFLPNGNSFSVK